MRRLHTLLGASVAAAALGAGTAAPAAASCVRVEGLHVCSEPVPGGQRVCARGVYRGRPVNYCTIRRLHGRRGG